MKVNKYIGMAMVALGVLAAASCTDFNDYNEVKGDDLASGNRTLWENILQNPELSQFKDLVQQAGFDKALSQSHYYTVFAPLNNTFDANTYAKLDSVKLLRQFVYNHVADYGHNATGSFDERVKMLNGKSYIFKSGTDSYMFDELNIANPNNPSSNGVLHVLSGAAAYYPNLYAFITDTLSAKEKGIDSLVHYIQEHEYSRLDESASVIGPIVDGRQTYIDSVMKTRNYITDMLNAKLEQEDSSYTFIIPNNEAWTKQYEHYKSYFNYLGTTAAENYKTNTSGSVELDEANPLSFAVKNPAFLKDSLTRLAMVEDLIFSNTNPYNQWVEGEPVERFGTDTLRTTLYTKLTNSQAIVNGFLQEKVKVSNGYARIVDSLAIYPWETIAYERSMSVPGNLIRVQQGNNNRITLSFTDRTVGEYAENGSLRYTWAQPNGGYARPEVDVYLPNLLSTTYDFYCVFVPEYFDNSKIKSKDELLPNRVNFEISYCDASGKLASITFLDESEENKAWCEEYLKKVKEEQGTSGSITPTASNKTTFCGFSNDPMKVDTVYIGRLTIPVCYLGLGSDNARICPNIKITSPFQATNNTFRAAFSRDLRIASIIAKPLELVEFEDEQNKQ